VSDREQAGQPALPGRIEDIKRLCLELRAAAVAAEERMAETADAADHRFAFGAANPVRVVPAPAQDTDEKSTSSARTRSASAGRKSPCSRSIVVA
jgi:hypothetical protein